jgi:5-methyltetrahydrofolate--homocysteine methyltransferase
MEKLKEMVIEGYNQETVERINILLDEGKKADDILNNALIPAMDKVGELFSSKEYFIPDLLVAARAMEEGMVILKPLLAEENNTKSLGKFVLGTVKGDLHDIGKTLVECVLKGAGFEVIDLGIDLPPEKFVEAIKEHNPIAVGLSALLTITMIEMKEVIDAITKAGLRDSVKILVGGAPVNQAYAEEIGADFYGEDPPSAKNYLLETFKNS